MSVPKARAGEAATAPASEKNVRLFMRRILLQAIHTRQAPADHQGAKGKTLWNVSYFVSADF
jgi:hypothetical protein